VYHVYEFPYILLQNIADVSNILFCFAGSLVPKLVGEKKTRSDGVDSMSASVFFVLYPALADFIVSVLKEANLKLNSFGSKNCTSQATPLPNVGDVPEVRSDECQTADVTDTQLSVENVVPTVTSSLLFPVLSLLCRLSAGLEVTAQGK